MYKRNQLIIGCSIICTAIIYSCTNSVSQNYVVNVNSFPKTELLKVSESIPIDIIDTRGLIISDSYLITYSRNEEKMIKVFNRKTNAFIGSFLTKGRSRDEVLFLTQIMQKDQSDGRLKLLIQSFPRYMNWLDVDSSLLLNKSVYVKRNEFNTKKQKDVLMNSGSSYDLGDNILLMNYNLPDDKYPAGSMLFYDVNKDCEIKRFSWVQVDKTIEHPDVLLNGNNAISADRKKMAQAFFFLDMITFCDLQTMATKNLLFSEDAIDYKKTEELMKNESFKPFYRTCASGTTYYYAVKNPININSDVASIIQLYTWDGEPKYEFTTKEEIMFIDVDEKTKQLYAIITTPEDNDLKLVVYNLPI